MVTKSKKHGNKKGSGAIKVGKLKLNKETVKDLTTSESKMVKGGVGVAPAAKLGGYQSISCGGTCSNSLCIQGKPNCS